MSHAIVTFNDHQEDLVVVVEDDLKETLGKMVSTDPGDWMVFNKVDGCVYAARNHTVASINVFPEGEEIVL